MISRRAHRAGVTLVPPTGKAGLPRWKSSRIRRTVLVRGWRAVYVLTAALATILAACSGASGARGTGRTSPAPTSAVSSPAVLSPAGTSPTPSSRPQIVVSTPPPPGTVVPFRTVAAGSAVGMRIGLVSSNTSDAFGSAVTDSVAVQLKSAGADLITCDPGDDQNLVLDCARRLATQKVSGWIIVQPGDLGQALCDVGPRGVPLIAIAASPISCQTAGIGADDVYAGFLVGQKLAGLPGSETGCARANFVIVTNPAAGKVNADRVAGIEAGISAVCPGLTGDLRMVDAGTQDRAYDAFTAALATLPADTDVLVAAVNDSAALGVIAATPAARSARLRVAAVGADQRARCQMVADVRWLGDAALFPDRYGEVAVPALLDALSGRNVPGDIYVRTTFVTAQTLTDFYPVTDCPSQ